MIVNWLVNSGESKRGSYLHMCNWGLLPFDLQFDSNNFGLSQNMDMITSLDDFSIRIRYFEYWRTYQLLSQKLSLFVQRQHLSGYQRQTHRGTNQRGQELNSCLACELSRDTVSLWNIQRHSGLNDLLGHSTIFMFITSKLSRNKGEYTMV